MKAIITDGCIACGLCEQICPEVFEMKDLAEVKPNADVDALLMPQTTLQTNARWE